MCFNAVILNKSNPHEYLKWQELIQVQCKTDIFPKIWIICSDTSKKFRNDSCLQLAFHFYSYQITSVWHNVISPWGLYRWFPPHGGIQVPRWSLHHRTEFFLQKKHVLLISGRTILLRSHTPWQSIGDLQFGTSTWATGSKQTRVSTDSFCICVHIYVTIYNCGPFQSKTDIKSSWAI